MSGADEGLQREVLDWSDLGSKMWQFLTGRQAAIHYRFDDVRIEVPRDIGEQAPRAVWKIDGTVTVTTTDAVS
ncbi:hypothetical protein ABFT23_06125 [Nocardioides sp. C4-1]|uniref:hypothetical protein n=1 Tax=Nocardioides sp. C4-1 TaxID=3151851 RepID=UPI003263C658